MISKSQTFYLRVPQKHGNATNISNRIWEL